MGGKVTRETFDNLMLIGRAGSGKSELIDFLKNVKETERLEKYHIGKFEEMDDFPWLLSMFEDEDIWEKLGRPRKFSKKIEKVYENMDYEIYKFTALKFDLEIRKLTAANGNYYNDRTLFVEFARGREDGYKSTLGLFSPEVLKRTAIFYMDNTFEESMRRNTTRSCESDTNQTILCHKVPLGIMEGYYKTHDWDKLTAKKPDGDIIVNGVNVPFVTVWNIPESHDFKVLEARYSPPLKKLWELYKNKNH